jgi:glutamine amidotransferase
MKKVAVIDYGMGNLMSVWRAWQHVGADAKIISSPSEMKSADVLVFPGQGCITDTIKLLKQTGFDNAIREWISADKPFFGICLGLQALFEYSEEGDVECLGVFKGSVKRLRLPHKFKVPHMGWDNVEFKRDGNESMLKSIEDDDQFYFVHSYYVDTPQSEIVFGSTEYGGCKFTSAIAKGNLVATQFHPEKSQSKGLALYSNFLSSKA